MFFKYAWTLYHQLRPLHFLDTRNRFDVDFKYRIRFLFWQVFGFQFLFSGIQIPNFSIWKSKIGQNKISTRFLKSTGEGALEYKNWVKKTKLAFQTSIVKCVLKWQFVNFVVFLDEIMETCLQKEAIWSFWSNFFYCRDEGLW